MSPDFDLLLAPNELFKGTRRGGTALIQSIDIFESLFLILPLIVAGVIHMLVVKFSLFQSLAIPIQASLFGKNKTWRGFVVMPPAGWMGLWISKGLSDSLSLEIFQGLDLLVISCLGLGLGFFYILFELPNSFLKRRAGVAPGEQASRFHQRALFFTLDHVDSLLGCVLVYALVLGPRVSVLLCLLVAPLIHILVNLLLWALSIRKEPF